MAGDFSRVEWYAGERNHLHIGYGAGSRAGNTDVIQRL